MYAAQGNADLEREVLSHYNITTRFPNEWPTELDQSDDEEEDQKAGVRRSRSRYSALERAASDRRTFIPGSQQTRDGKANVVQKDEPDPLGAQRSVITSLKQRGLPIDHDSRLRNRFLLSSTTFSPALFLSQTHADASTQDLVQGLRYLEQSIDQKSASLKVLVETNFERFVRAKATIDNVYTEMRNQGMESVAPLPATSTGPPSPKARRHSRQVSRNSGMHQRITSTGSIAPPPPPSKNALRKESEYGVKGVKGPLLEVSQRAEDVWGPALEGREREAGLKDVAEAVTKDRAIYELGRELQSAAQQKNYERVVELFASARSYASQATAVADSAAATGQKLTDAQVHRVLVTGRMWADVQEQTNELKKEIWRRLSNVENVHRSAAASQVEEHMELISILLELGVEDNPIWVWLLSRYDALKSKISAVTGRSKVEIEILRRRLAGADPPSQESAAAFLRMAEREPAEAVDAEPILDFWKTVSAYVNKLVSKKDGLLGEIIEFWESAKSFIDGNKQKSLPVGFEGESRRHHRLSDTGVRDLSNGTVELVNLVRESLYALFAEGPTEDISSIFSPLTGASGTPKTPATPMFSPSEGRLGNIDETTMPPSPKKGDAWEDFAFWPPHSNGLSAALNVSRILSMLASGAGDMIAMEPVFQDSLVGNNVRALVNIARARCLTAVCMTWSKDSVYFTSVEDWLKSPDKRNQTRLPAYFFAYERVVINGLQQILYLEGANQHSSTSLVAPPSTNNIQLARQKFTDSIFALLSGMLQNAERAVRSKDDEWVATSEAFRTASDKGSTDISTYSVDASNRSVRMLLTISNVKVLRSDYVPQLIQLFETSFSMRFSDEITQINNKFTDVDRLLFQSYTKPAIVYITQLIKDGINSPDWEPSTTRPDQVSPYVYASMMVLVNIHTEVSTTVANAGTTNSTLLQEILSYLLEHMSQALLDGFIERRPNKYSLAALIQATLDTEFIAQTMSQYATKRVGDNQNEIYVVLDKRTTNEARADLQKELAVMKVVLKNLRDSSRIIFGCFKRIKSGDKDRPKAERQQT